MPADDLIGERLGPYTIVGWLGEGAMAKVYRARHERLGKEVALKVVRRVPGDREDSSARFQREKAVLEKLHHPHILAIQDYSGNSDYLFIASPVIEGGTLEDRLGCWPAAEVAEIVVQLGGALDYAHQMNVVHRDIKPSNVLIDRSRDGSSKHYYLADFGVAKMLEAEGLTMPGMTVGTPEYMSPEQVLGKPLGAPADQYSLAILAYRLLTGKVPFTGTMPSVMQQHAKASPPPMGPDVPDAVERVVLRALAKDPKRRFKSGADFGEAMVEATGGKVEAPKPAAAPALPAFSGPLADGPPRPPEPRSWAWVVWVLALALLVAGGWYAHKHHALPRF